MTRGMISDVISQFTIMFTVAKLILTLVQSARMFLYKAAEDPYTMLSDSINLNSLLNRHNHFSDTTLYSRMMFLTIVLPLLMVSTSVALPIHNSEGQASSLSSPAVPASDGSAIKSRDGFYGIYSGYTGYSGGEATTAGTDPSSEYG